MPASTPTSGKLDVAQQPGAAGAVELDVEGVGQLEDGAGDDHRLARLGVLVAVEVQHALATGCRVVLQLPVQHPQGQVGEVEHPLVGLDEVGGERRVAGQAGQLPATGGQGVRRTLGVVQRLGPAGVGEPVGHRLLGLLVEARDVEVCGAPAGGRDGQGTDVAGAAGPLSDDVDAGALPRLDVLVEPGRHLGRRQDVAVHVEARLGLGGDRVQGLEQSLPQHPELEAVEHLVHQLAVPRLAFELVDRDAQRHVADQLVEPAVAQHAVEVLAQGVADLAADLVDVGDDPRQVAVGGDPLRRRLGADPRYAGEVVGRLAHQRRQVAVALRGYEVALLDGGGVHPPHVGDAADGVDHGHVVADQLEHVAVARDDDDLHALRGRLRREGGDDVVGLVAGRLDVADLQGVEHLVDQRDLAGELGGGGAAPGLVLRILLEPEGLPGQVEGDPDVGRLLVAEHVDEHRREPVDGVGVLAGLGREVLGRQGVERAVCQRVAVEEQEPVRRCHDVHPRPRHRHRTPPLGAGRRRRRSSAEARWRRSRGRRRGWRCPGARPGTARSGDAG